MSRIALLFGSALLLILLVNLSCQDIGVAPPPPRNGGGVVDTVSFQSDVYPIFANYGCNGCHSGSANISWYAGTATQTYDRLVNIEAATACAPDKRVLPGNASQSVLYRRLEGSTCGDRMPQGGDPIAPSDLALIRDWINQGALRN